MYLQFLGVELLSPKVVAGSLCLLNIYLTYLSKFKINTYRVNWFLGVC